MRPPVFLAATLLLVSGCMGASTGGPDTGGQGQDEPDGNDSDPQDPAAQDSGSPLGSDDGRLSAVGCEFVEFGFPVEPNHVEDWLPEGFGVSTFMGVYGVVETNQLVCDRLIVGNTTTYEDYAEATIQILVDPPADIAPEAGMRSAFLVARWSTADQAYAAIVPERTAGFQEGTSDWTMTDLAADLGLLEGSSAKGDGDESWHYALIVDSTEIFRGASARVYYDAEAGPRWMDEGVEGRFNARTFGGQVELQEGSLLHQLVGRSSWEGVLSDYGMQVSKEVVAGG